ncbi:complement C3-like isoform X2 [Amphiprion ocellaris]|uniref:complement C3-like isoform X2 n=1 Tax=Amphiprion ocellaris TaxID=80972 RepID=UPI0024117E6C|nr:complement C3-like isoform X2 [Amphiprion ocellaris]
MESITLPSSDECQLVELSCDRTLRKKFTELKVGPVDGICRDYAPGKSFSFQIRGDPGAKVSLVAVDNAVYLLNKARLTQRKPCSVQAVPEGDALLNC